jgi:hypothetical protein
MEDLKKKRFRNLRQNKNLTDDEFDEYWDKKLSNAEPSAEFERRIQRKYEEFALDYDLDDLKINDKSTLRALIQAALSLEDYEQMLFRVRQSGDISLVDVNSIDKLSKIMTDIRGDISKLQTDLNITRRIRKSDKEASVVNYIDSLKTKAKLFYESKMAYVFCECGMLLGTVWTLYPEENNVISLKCNRVLDNGNKCGIVTKVTTKELFNNRGTNKKDIIPESLL